MNIASASSAFPKNYYPQTFLMEKLQEYWGDALRNPALLARLHRNVAVEGRYLSLPYDKYQELDTWGKANDVWIATAKELGEKALHCALERAGVDKSSLGALFFTSVTGISSPSIDALLINQMGLPKNIRRVPIFGLGCVAGAAGISRAADYVKAYPDQAAALLSVELCSLTLQRDDLSMAHLISALLFGDGAAATIVTGDNRKADGPEILATKSSFYLHSEKVMGWDISEKGFRIVLSPEVPEMVTKHLGKDVDAFLAENGAKRSDIKSWIMHTGGPKVLEATATALGITANDLAASWACLRRVGNISSTSVLLVLEDVYSNRRPEPGSLSILAAMGPGFCAELVLLRW